MAVGDAYVFPGFLTPVLTQLFFPKPPTTFLTCFCRGERRKYAGKKSRLNRGSNSQPPGHESDTLTTEPPWQGFVPEENFFLELHKKFHFVTMATTDFDGIKFCEQFLKKISQGTFLPSLVQIGPTVWEEMMFKEILDNAKRTPGDL